MAEDLSQTTNAPAAEDASLTTGTTVTAAGMTPADNATPPQDNNSAAPPAASPEGGQAGEGVDDEAQAMRDYEALKDSYLKGAPQAPVLPPPAAAPSVQPQAPANPPPPAAAAAVTDDEDYAPRSDGTIPQIKLRPTSAQDLQMLAAYKGAQKAGSTQTLVQFIQSQQAPAAQQTPGQPPATPEVQQDQPPGQAPRSLGELETQIKALRDKKYEHLYNYDFDKAREVEEQIDTLTLQRTQVQATEQSAAQQFATQENSYLQKAGALYPEAANPDSALAQRAREIFAHWESQNDPRAAMPQRGLYVYMEAAESLGISAAPQTPSAPVQSSPSTSTPPPAHRPPLSAMIAGGDARSTQHAPASVEINSMDDYQKAKSAYLSGGRR